MLAMRSLILYMDSTFLDKAFAGTVKIFIFLYFSIIFLSPLIFNKIGILGFSAILFRIQRNVMKNFEENIV